MTALSPAPPSAPQRPSDPKAAAAGPRLFVRNRRDGARLLSSILIITTIGLVAWSHPLGRAIALAGGALSLFWWLQYRQLRQ